MFLRALYAIKDIKSGFADPCIQANDAVAIRGFENSLPYLSDKVGIPVSDFQLWRVGQFDVDSGILRPETPQLLLDGASIFRKDVTSDEKSECPCTDSE